ncbi:hypothetical protein EDB89DRAFT_563642 [Lactarius sanguifluus]|nr:hypothetical protein EDB89DRAFT_563642 [Lactarius sanguifluus]
MKELMPRIIASGHVANVIQLIKHTIKGPKRSDADQIMILETLETIAVPIRTLQGKLNERSQRSLLGLLKFLKEQHLYVMFRDIDNLTGSVYQFIVKIGEKIIPLAVQGLGTPNLWQSAQSILFEYEDTCPDLADTLNDSQTWIRRKLLHYQFSAAQPSRKPLLLPAPSESHSSESLAVVTTHPRQPLSKPAAPNPRLSGPASPRHSTAKPLEADLFQRVRSDSRRNAHRIAQPLYSRMAKSTMRRGFSHPRRVHF